MKILFFILLLTFGVSGLSAHDEKSKHDTSEINHNSDDSLLNDEGIDEKKDPHDKSLIVNNITAKLSDFPTLHPLIVHFAIALIILSAFIQLLNILLLKKEIAWIITGILFIGFLSAYLASTNFHPHTTGLTNKAKWVLEQHDDWAEWTNTTAAIALIAQFAYIFFTEYKKRTKKLITVSLNRILVFSVAIIMMYSAFCVIRAGHYGAQLVHIEGVGPQGKYLELDEHD